MCFLFLVFVFFFFKQKTAYEMRISDWSSDVCSSDLIIGGSGPAPVAGIAIPDHPDIDRGAGRDLGRIAAIEVELELSRQRIVGHRRSPDAGVKPAYMGKRQRRLQRDFLDRKSTRLNSSH